MFFVVACCFSCFVVLCVCSRVCVVVVVFVCFFFVVFAFVDDCVFCLCVCFVSLLFCLFLSPVVLFIVGVAAFCLCRLSLLRDLIACLFCLLFLCWICCCRLFNWCCVCVIVLNRRSRFRLFPTVFSCCYYPLF